MNHRIFLTVISFCCTLFFSCDQDVEQKAANSSSNTPWEQAAEIEKNMVIPVFQDKTFNVLEFGVKEGADINNAASFAKAVAACHKAGGGKVVVPAGVYYTGAIHLLDNVNLHLEKDAEIRFSTNDKDYLPLVHTSFEGTELMNYSPLIYAYQQENIAVTGEGTLNGQADNENWWYWCGKDIYGWKDGMPSQNDEPNRPHLSELSTKNVPVKDRIFGEGHYIRPSFVEFFECKNILIQNVKIINAPFWVIHPIKSEFITVDGVTIESHGPNNDGCDPEYSKNVVIKNCTFNTGDDCIAIKSGRDEDGRRVGIKSERIIVKHCKMIDVTIESFLALLIQNGQVQFSQN